MKVTWLSLLGCIYCIASCSVLKRNEPLSYTARGCQLDSLKKQSALIFERIAKRRHYPKEQSFIHQVYEKDSVIVVQWFPVDKNNTWGNGMLVTISKKDCRVLSEYWFQ